VKKPRSQEIASFNRELMNFDFSDLSVEELDRRLELAVANALIGVLNDCASNCANFSCTANCGANTTIPKPIRT
jgi:hypothetical protein